mgnify:FL=1
MVILLKCILSLLALPFLAALSLPMRAGTSHHVKPVDLKKRRVMIPTAEHGDQVGEIQYLRTNPVHNAGLCAYVPSLPGAPVWSEWIPVHEIPAETCPYCEVHYYPYQMCDGCGSCEKCCTCKPAYVPEPAEGEEDCLWFLCDADTAYDEWRINGG